MTHPLRPLRPVLPALAVALLAATTSHAEMIIFKDGTVLQGKVVRESKTIVDPANGQAFEVNEGFFMVYDGARTLVFSTAHLDRAIDDKEFAPEKGELRSGVASVRFPGSRPLPPIVEVTDFGQFDKDWNRTFTYTTLNDQTFSVKQNLTQLTPYFTRLDSAVNIKNNIQYLGTTCYLTKELGRQGWSAACSPTTRTSGTCPRSRPRSASSGNSSRSSSWPSLAGSTTPRRRSRQVGQGFPRPEGRDRGRQGRPDQSAISRPPRR